MYQKVKDLVAEHLGIEPDGIKPESTLEELGADSLDIVELTMVIEEYFNIEISDDVVEQTFTTVKSVVDYLEANVTK